MQAQAGSPQGSAPTRRSVRAQRLPIPADGCWGAAVMMPVTSIADAQVTVAQIEDAEGNVVGVVENHETQAWQLRS